MFIYGHAETKEVVYFLWGEGGGGSGGRGAVFAREWLGGFLDWRCEIFGVLLFS